MNTEKRFFVGDIVEIVSTNSGNSDWIGVRAIVEPWPENEEQFLDGLLHNWLSPIYNRPDGFGVSEFMWPTQSLQKVG
jgi:hypothetical protein